MIRVLIVDDEILVRQVLNKTGINMALRSLEKRVMVKSSCIARKKYR